MKDEVLEQDNVVGYGDGKKVVGGTITDKEAKVIFVKEKLPEAQLKPEEVIPKEMNGKPTDVIEIGEVEALDIDRTERMRPCEAGMSIGHKDITAGTFGGVVRKKVMRYDTKCKKVEAPNWLRWLVDKMTGGKILTTEDIGVEEERRLIISNNHVLAATQLVGDPSRVGDEILQPGPIDGGKLDTDVIATLYEVIPLDEFENTMDVALALPIHDQDIKEGIVEIGVPQGVNDNIKYGQMVQKSGRTTGRKSAKVITTGTTIYVNFGEKRLQFNNQIVSECISAGGDSGSLVLDDKKNVVGLLFAGSDKATIINPIGPIIERLNISF